MHLPELAAVGTLGFARRSRVNTAATQSQKNRLRSGQALPWSKHEGHNLDLDHVGPSGYAQT